MCSDGLFCYGNLSFEAPGLPKAVLRVLVASEDELGTKTETLPAWFDILKPFFAFLISEVGAFAGVRVSGRLVGLSQELKKCHSGKLGRVGWMCQNKVAAEILCARRLCSRHD